MSKIRRNIIDDDDDDDDSWCEQNIIKLIIVICLTIIAISCSIILIINIIKQTQCQKVLLAKKSVWSTRLEQCAPILKVAAPIIKNIIKVAFSIILI